MVWGRRVAWILFALVLAALVSACSSGSEDGELTIEEFVELPSEEAFRETWESVEESKQACMAEVGFQYVPHVQPYPAVNLTEAFVRGALIVGEDREVVERYGYGIAAGISQANEFFASDPNRELREALRTGESLEYGEAFENCATEAQETAGLGETYRNLSTQLTTLISELETEIISDPRLAGVTEQWAACMNERGHSFRLLSGPRDEIVSRINTFLPDESLDQEAAREETDAFYARLLDEELELAVDDLDCRDESGVSDVLPRVRDEAGAEFVDQHGDLLAEVQAVRSGS